MSSTISSVGGYSSMMTGMSRPPRPDSTKLAEELFSQIDSSGKGYIEQSDLEAAFDQVSSTSSGTSADKLFSSLDSDGDGKVTRDEMASGLQSLMESLDSQFQSMRMSDAMGAMGNMPPPPPPPENDTGFTKEELEAQLEEVGSTDSKRSELISSVIENFDAADTDGDGKVSFKEAMAYDQSTSSTSSATSSSTATSDATTASTSTASTEAQLMLQIMKLAQAYGLFGHENGSSSVSATA
jgi:Ca2+-binding EF-hand superfamily protein